MGPTIRGNPQPRRIYLESEAWPWGCGFKSRMGLGEDVEPYSDSAAKVEVARELKWGPDCSSAHWTRPLRAHLASIVPIDREEASIIK
jgi:hypothetical protein